MLTKNDLKQIRVIVQEEIKEEVEPIKKQLGVVGTKVATIGTKLDTVEIKVELVNKRVDQLSDQLKQTEQRLGKAIIKSQEDTIETLSSLIHTGYNLQDKRIKKIEDTLQITNPQQ